jgi:hypothetical protein
MVWTKKSSAPVAFRLGDAFQGMILSDTLLNWLLAWTPLMDPQIYETAPFCALGPPPAVPNLTLSDFIGVSGADWIGRALALVGLKGRLEDIARDHIFAAFCENAVSTGETCTLLGRYSTTSDGTVVPDRTVVPSTTTNIKFRVVVPRSAGPAGINVYGWPGAVLLSSSTFAGGFAVGAGYDVPFTMAAHPTGFGASVSGDVSRDAVWDVFVCSPGSFVGFTPSPQDKPVGLPDPLTRVYVTVPDLGAELDNLEHKLETLINWVAWLVQDLAVAPGSEGPPTDPTAGPIIAPKAIGYRIDVSGVPAGQSETFGAPVKLIKIGRYTIGNASGWLPSVDITHNPCLVMPLPVGVDRIQVHMNPPTVASVRALFPAK